jgi:hypothetical protein
MIDNKTTKGAPVAAPPKPKSREFGIEPGSLRGRGAMYGSQKPVDHDAEILKTVDAMDGKEMRRWMRIPGNTEALDKAIKAKGRTK